MFWLSLGIFFCLTLIEVHGIEETVSSGDKTSLWLILPLLVAGPACLAAVVVWSLVALLRQPRPPSNPD
jgi:hypothetical protein